MPDNTPAKKFPQGPRSTLGAQIWPYQVTAKLTPSEIEVERLVYTIEVEAARPPWQAVLAGALAGIGGVR